MNAYEARRNLIDQSVMPFGTRAERDRFEEYLAWREQGYRWYGELYVSEEVRASGMPGFCLRRGKHITVSGQRRECTNCNPECRYFNNRKGEES
jgi:hypothetical protein